jgi:undecaprenyl-phosphate alpha-N-acetylglucosaminyl 1-phosphatetransferase
MISGLPFALATFVATTLLIAMSRPIALRLGLVDVPGGHKRHTELTPVVGGIAMLVGVFVCCGFYCALGFGPAAAWGLFVPAAVVALVGLIDDYRGLGVKIRFAFQILAALMLVHLGGAEIATLGDLLGTGNLMLGVVAVPFTVFAIVGAINAVNMSDGMDGLAGGLVAVSLLLLAVATSMSTRVDEAYLLVSLLGAVAAFLIFNLRCCGRGQAAVFMGDAGSMFLGLVLAYFLIVLAQGPDRIMSPVVALWIFGVPLIDTISTMLRRILKGRSPFRPDNEHLHHIFIRAGFSVNQTLAVILAAHLGLGGIGLLAYHLGVPDYILFFAILLIGFAYFALILRAWRVMRVLHRLRLRFAG